ncbi:MAG: imidazoleglycerol-phosphate dehydratase HisB [Alphaproteobacteria bacterium]|nr:imidazoleglycerol-phosphate dehydratase HisB [Alphaproteobacteria bacterium]
MSRTATLQRQTKETKISVTLNVDGTGNAQVATGLGFYDHMLMALAKHGRFDVALSCDGDTHIDDHHTVEDCALALGQAFDQALGDRANIRRFGSAYAPLDEALVRAVVDLSGRPFAAVNLQWRQDRLGQVATQNLVHALQSLATAARMTLHVDQVAGVNDHHIIEAAYKAVALALRHAVSADAGAGIPSTKGVL